jgi:hypothetical protein
MEALPPYFGEDDEEDISDDPATLEEAKKELYL